MKTLTKEGRTRKTDNVALIEALISSGWVIREGISLKKKKPKKSESTK